MQIIILNYSNSFWVVVWDYKAADAAYSDRERDLRIFREHEIYSGDICQTSGERNEDEMNTVQLCQYSIQGTCV